MTKNNECLIFDIDDEIKAFLETTYVGPAARFRLEFYADNLHKIEKYFDEIILKHGIRDVEFDYAVVVLDSKLERDEISAKKIISKT